MKSCLRLSPSAAVTRTDAGVILRSDLGTFQVTGADASAFVEKVVPLLDGSRDLEAIVEALSGYSRRSVTAFLDLLEARGLLSPVSDTAARWHGQEAFFRMWSRAPADAMQQLGRARVLLVGLEPWGATAAVELAAAGLGALHMIDDGAARRQAAAATIAEQSPWCRIDESPMEALDAAPLIAASGPWNLLIAAISPADTAQMERAARLAHRINAVSLWSHLAETTAVLGPLVTPGSTACRICATAEALNPPLAPRTGPSSAPLASAMAQLLGHMVAMEALRVITGYAPSELGGRLLMEDLRTLETSFYTLVRIPWCRVCGEGSDRS